MTELFRDPLAGTPGDDLSTYNAGYVMVTGVTGVMVINSSGVGINLNTTSGTTSYYRSDVTPPSPDYSVRADLTMVAQVVSGPACGVIGRAQPGASTCYEARFLANGSGTGTWQLRRFINGTAVTLTTTAAPSYVNGQVFDIKLDMKGSTISLYVDGATVPVLTATDTGITSAGFAGVRGFNNSSGRFRLSNLVADDGQAATPGVSATISWDDPQDTAALAVALTDRADIASTDPADTMVIAAAAINRAALQWTDPADSALLVGAVNTPAPTGVAAALAWTDPPDVSGLIVLLKNRAAISLSEPADTWVLAANASQLTPLSGTIRLDALARDLRTKTIHFSN